jgi:large subunit ribosomal protein L25
MLKISAKIRDKVKKGVNFLRGKNLVPAVLYGPKIKNLNLEVNSKDFKKAHEEAGESLLVALSVDGHKDFLVLIHDIQLDPISGDPIHVDFYQPALTEEIEIAVPIVVEGQAPAEKNLGGTLVKNISEIEIKALPQKLPKEIKVNVEKLATFEDYILVKDLQVPEGVKILRDGEEILISVSPPEKVEEEAKEKPAEEAGEKEGEAGKKTEEKKKTETKKEESK